MSTHSGSMQLARRALAHYQNKTTDQAPDVMEIDVDAYINPDRYDVEKARVFKRLPLALALSLEISEPGDIKAMDVVETPVLLVRDEQGSARAFLNVCRHRGARLCEVGRDKRRVIACPYHAWTYNLQGKLTGQYGASTFGDIDPDTRGLTELPCAEKSDLVWVSLTPGETLDISAWLGDFSKKLDTLELTNWYLFDQRTIPGPGWKATMDGYLEAYHHNLVHPETVGKYTVGNLLVLDTDGPHQRLTFGRKSLGELSTQPESDWQPDEHIRLIHSVFPNLSVSGILGDHCLVSQIFPGPTPDSTLTVQYVLSAKEPKTAEELAATQAFSDMVLRAVRDEDYRAVRGIQDGLRSGANQSFLIGRNEPAVQNYHQWIAHYMAISE